MLAAVLQKRIANGSVVPMIEKPKHDAINKEVKKTVDLFYKGDKLTEFEVDVQRMYLSLKMAKLQKYKRRPSIRFKVRWTLSDLNRYQD